MREFVDEFFANFVREFKYEIRTMFLHEKLVMLRMACTIDSFGKFLIYTRGLTLISLFKEKQKVKQKQK